MVLTCRQDIHHSPLSELAGTQYILYTLVVFFALAFLLWLQWHHFHPLSGSGVQLVVSVL